MDTHVIQRQAPQTFGKPVMAYMQIDEGGYVSWVADKKTATRFPAHIAAALAYGLRQDYEKTMTGPSYWSQPWNV